MSLSQIRASKPNRLLSVVPCKSFGLRPQVEFAGKAKMQWALDEVGNASFAVALVDYEGRFIAKSAAWPV